jgi:hypothetical protein
MIVAAFTGDVSVITLWDPDNNALVGVISEALSVFYYSSCCTFAIIFTLVL